MRQIQELFGMCLAEAAANTTGRNNRRDRTATLNRIHTSPKKGGGQGPFKLRKKPVSRVLFPASAMP